jgi:signal transduction histidine kinase
VKRNLIILFLITSVLHVYSQINKATLSGAYVYNFARYTTWPAEALSDSFLLVLVSSQPELIEEFKTFAATRTLHNKPIQLILSSQGNIQLRKAPNLIFISKEKSNLFIQVYERYLSQPVLIVTESQTNKSMVMINFYNSTSGELLFEVNKANIINHNLAINPEILLSGGSEIDVAELYRQLQKSLEREHIRIEALNDSLLNLRTVINATIEKLDKQQKEILYQEQKLVDQERMLSKQEQEIAGRKNELSNQQLEIKEHQKEIEIQKALFVNQIKAIEEKSNELLEQQKLIDVQKAEIETSKRTLDKLTADISTKNEAINKQSSIINRQKSVLLLIVIVVVLFLFILILLLIAFNSKKKRNKILFEQKAEIEAINKRIRITNQKLFNTIGQLKETQSQLVSSEKMASLGVLTAGIAHEINNPVNFIYTGINSIKKDFDDLLSLYQIVEQLDPNTDNSERISEIDRTIRQLDMHETVDIIVQTIEDIKIGAERTANIIRGLRNFSRVDKDSMVLADIHEGIDTALLLLKNKFKQNISIEKKYSKLPCIECYPSKLNQAFLNILGNSIDSIEGQGKITITTNLTGNYVQIEIEDSGIGIPAANLDKIFDPFFTTKNVGKGVGLGLSITYGIINEHNGKIEVKSEENQGTVFTILLPCELN